MWCLKIEPQKNIDLLSPLLLLQTYFCLSYIDLKKNLTQRGLRKKEVNFEYCSFLSQAEKNPRDFFSPSKSEFPRDENKNKLYKPSRAFFLT